MTSKEALLVFMAIAFVAVVIMGIIFHQDVKSSLDYLVMLFLGHHAVLQPSDDKNGNGIPDDEETKIPDAPKIVPASFVPAPTKSVRMKITHYGEVNDPYGDTLTREGWGNVNNKLNLDSCALTVSAQKVLGAREFDWLEVDFGNGTVIRKQFADRAPETEERLDVYNPHNLKWSYPDYAEVSIVKSDILTA